jgi:tetrahydromethanopterin S-methyltransferase subunit C
MNKTNSQGLTGVASAAILSSGIGIFVLGVLTTLKASSESIRKVLSFYLPTGPLSGLTTLAVGVWLIVWFVLHRFWKDKELNFQKIFTVTIILIALGFLGSFPLLFEIFFEAYE